MMWDGDRETMCIARSYLIIRIQCIPAYPLSFYIQTQYMPLTWFTLK